MTRCLTRRYPSHSIAEVSQSLIHLTFEVADRYDGWRLDHFLQATIRRLSRSRIQQMIRNQPRLGGHAMRAASRVRAGQAVRLVRPAPDEPAVPRHFSVLHDDPTFLVINKPAGLPVHATARFHRNTLTAVLRERYPDQSPTLVHRIDKETSGVLLVAKSKQAEAQLKKQFALRKVKKTYLALVCGTLPWPNGEGVIDHPIADDETSGIRIRRTIANHGLPARTVVRTRETRGDFSLIEAKPETGRQHQIRIHLSAVGCPLVGDKLYGPDPGLMLEYLETGWTPQLAESLLLPRHALHAESLTFIHPGTGDLVCVSAPLPADLCEFWAGLGKA